MISSFCGCYRQWCTCFYAPIGAEGTGVVSWWEVPRMLLMVLPKRSIPMPDPHGQDIIQHESSCTYM